MARDLKARDSRRSTLLECGYNNNNKQTMCLRSYARLYLLLQLFLIDDVMGGLLELPIWKDRVGGNELIN